MSKIEELKNEADELGVSYSANIGEAKLQSRIDEFYSKESNNSGAVIAEVKEEVEEVVETPTKTKPSKLTAKQRHRAAIAKMEAENMETSVVKVMCVDKVEASTATDAYFSNGDVGMRVPLDVFIELPNILITQIRDAKTTVHVKTSNGAVPKDGKRYIVEYK